MNKFTLFLFFLGTLAFGQTKLISHKSHSGSMADFALAAENGMFDMNNSNFGHAPERMVRNSVLDSVIFISEGKAIMVTSEYCHSVNKEKTEYASRWTAGRDTVYNHPLFAKQHSLDSIKKVLKRDYFFKDGTDYTVFVGYDNKTKKNKKEARKKKKSAVPVTDTNKMPPSKPLMVSVLLIVSCFIMAISYQASRKRQLS